MITAKHVLAAGALAVSAVALTGVAQAQSPSPDDTGALITELPTEVELGMSY